MGDDHSHLTYRLSPPPPPPPLHPNPPSKNRYVVPCVKASSTSNINHKTELYYLYCILYKGTSTIVLHAIKYCSSILFYTILVLYTLD